MSSRQAKLRPALRVIAAGCILLWLSASSYCSVEHFFESGDHAHAHGHAAGTAVANAHAAAQPIHQEHSDVAKTQDADDNGQGSDHHDDEDGFCCSTLHATAQTPQQALAAPAFHVIAFLRTLLNAQELVSTPLQATFDRHARSHEWVFTPEVSLGPAFRSHAPPLAI